MGNVVLLILVSLSFMLLVGSLNTGNEEFALDGKWKTAFISIFFVGLAGIFLHAIQFRNQPFLEWGWDNVQSHCNTDWFGSLILILIILLFISYITKEQKPSTKTTSSAKEGGD